MFHRTCTACDGHGTVGSMLSIGEVGVHVVGDCRTCGGKGFTSEGWVAWYNRIRVERFKRQFAEAHGREMTEDEQRNLGILENV